MKRFTGLILFLAWLLAGAWVWAAPVAPGQVVTVESLGVAPVGDDQARARDQAVAQALGTAVGRVVLGMVDPATLRDKLALLEEKILSQARRFVSTYSLESHAISGERMLVLVSVVVDRGALDQALARGGLTLPAARRRLTLVLVSEEAAPGRPVVYWWSGFAGVPAAPAPVERVLKSLGVRTVDPKTLAGKIPAEARRPVLSESDALALARRAGAGLVILGRVRTYPLVTPPAESPPPVAQLMALDVVSGRPLAVVESEGPVFNQTPDPQAGAQVTAAVERAVRDLMEKVAAKAPPQQARPGKLMLVIRGVRNLADLHHFEKVLASLNLMVSSLRRRAVGPGWARLSLELKVPPSQLADRLVVQDFGDFLVNVVDSSPEELKLMMIPKD